MENTIGIIIGALGLAVAVFVAVRQVQVEKRQKKQSRLDFLVNIIIDEDIPRESRQIFYDEYVALRGNGTVNKFWLRTRRVPDTQIR